MVRKALAGSGISVLLQGTLRLDQAGVAQNAIKSVRNVLPSAEIVISHPEHENPRGLEGDKFVSYADPGPDICFCGNSEMNLSRQIVSMKTGLEVIDRPFVLKFRPEFALDGNGFVSEDSLGKIRVTNAFTHNLNKDLRYMHVSDVIQFGALGRMLDFCPQTSRTRGFGHAAQVKTLDETGADAPSCVQNNFSPSSMQEGTQLWISAACLQ
jgi:hypothetical protein